MCGSRQDVWLHTRLRTQRGRSQVRCVCRPVPSSTPFTFYKSTQEVALKLTSCFFSQGTFPTRRAAQAGLTPASGVKVGICIKILHLKVKQHFHSIIVSHSHPVINHIAHICLGLCCRGVPVPSGSLRPAADRGPDPDPSPGPHWPSLHPELWFCINWEFRSYR